MTVFRMYELVDAFNNILQLRDASDYDCVSVVTDSGTTLQVVSKDLRGNLGNFIFLSKGNTFGGGIIAASATAKDELQEYYKREDIFAVVVKALCDGRLWYEDPRLPDGNNAVVLEVQYSSQKTHDSEYILMNLLYHELHEKGIESGKLQLITERVPCASCTDVILKFKRDYPDVDIEVYYFMNTVSLRKGKNVVRTSREVLQQLKGTPISLFQCVEQDGQVDMIPQP